MTTVIVVVVVALVFFVTLCVVTFMVWKREEEMRTDSLRAIEANLQELGYRMTSDFGKNARRSIPHDGYIEPLPVREPVARPTDPFSWTREDIKAQVGASDEPVIEPAVAGTPDAVAEQLPEGGLPTNAKGDENGTGIDEVTCTPTNAPNTDAAHVAEVNADNAPELRAEGDEPYSEEFVPLDKMGAPETEGARDSGGEDGEHDETININSFDQLMNDEFEIDMDALDIPNFMSDYIAEYSADDVPQERPSIGRDVGRSGRRYTAEELDMLIKE